MFSEILNEGGIITLYQSVTGALVVLQDVESKFFQTSFYDRKYVVNGCAIIFKSERTGKMWDRMMIRT